MESAQIKPHVLRKHTALLPHSSTHTHLPLELLIPEVIAANIARKFPHFISSLSSVRHSTILYQKISQEVGECYVSCPSIDQIHVSTDIVLHFREERIFRMAESEEQSEEETYQ